MRATARGASFPAVLALALALWSCGDDDVAPLPCDMQDGTCQRTSDDDLVPLPCDIRDGACQRSVFHEMARLRDQKGAELPPIRVITRAQYADETRRAVSEEPISRSGEILQGVLRLLRFLPPETSVGEAAAESSIQGVKAYYHKHDKSVTIIADSAMDELGGTYTLAHEFVHALQDQRENLEALDAEGVSADGELAVDCLVEGEATVLSDTLLVRLRDGATARPNFPPYFDRMLASYLTQVEKSTAPLTLALMILPYPVGGRALATAYEAQGHLGIQTFYRARPTTMLAWVDANRKVTAIGCDPPAPPLGYAQYGGKDRLGAAGLLSLYTRTGLTGVQAFEVAQAWTNDAFTIYATPSGPAASAFAWRIVLRDVASAQALEARLLAAALPQVAISRSEQQVVIAGATDPAALAAWTDRDACRMAKGRSAEDTPTERLFTTPFDDRVSQRAHHHLPMR